MCHFTSSLNPSKTPLPPNVPPCSPSNSVGTTADTVGLILPKRSWLKLARISSATWLKITNYRKWLVKTQGDGRQAWSGAASKSPGDSVVLDHFMLQRKPNSQYCRFSIFQKKTLSHSCPDRALLWRSAIPIRKSNLFFLETLSICG